MGELLIPVNGFKLTPMACLAEGRPTFESWATMLAQCEHAHRSLGWWIGDLLNYGEAAYGERYAQAVQATGLAVQTLMNYKSLAKAIPPAERVEGVSVRAHMAIARANPEVRQQLLERARKDIAEGRMVATLDIELWKDDLLRVVDLSAIKPEPLITVRFTEAEAWAILDDLGGAELLSAREKVREALLRL